MILVNAPQHDAVLSNVGQIGEFRIRNSAKAFSILSSGLYANKIRAIVRELSCNAVDSHIAAGKKTTPFDVHLPNQLEPWFSIRDYGVGLTHDQVTNIYTTYFESTKTGSNDFIGALGLGSKSPFSYTDNFTVTAIKDGRRGIYSAFINENGVPSIAEMMSEETTEPNGVEVKFSVNDRYDFDKFKHEAVTVYRYFDLRPVVSGQNVKIDEIKYTDKDIVPGVHTNPNDRDSSIAIMGNIAYPIDIPSGDNSLGEYSKLLRCGLIMHFGIGELDFQASREGLSYIPETIEAIKKKLIAVTGALTVRLAVDADKITNMWERALFLTTKSQHQIWSTAATKYVNDGGCSLIDANGRYGSLATKSFKFTEATLAKEYNIKIRAFTKSSYASTASNMKASIDYSQSVSQRVDSTFWHFPVSESTYFIENDTKVGALDRAKYHWRSAKIVRGHAHDQVFVFEKADKTKAMKVAALLKELATPPVTQVMLASTLSQKERVVVDRAKNVTIMELVEKSNGSYRHRWSNEMVWRDGGKADTFDKSTTHYYIPLSGYALISEYEYSEAKALFEDMKGSGIPELASIRLHGVRKGDIELIKTQKNWVNVEKFILGKVTTLSPEFRTSMVMNELDRYDMVCYNETLVNSITDKTSPYVTLTSQFKNIKAMSHSPVNQQRLFRRFAPKVNLDVTAVREKLVKECQSVYAAYPLFTNLSITKSNVSAIAEYINLVNASKKGSYP